MKKSKKIPKTLPKYFNGALHEDAHSNQQSGTQNIYNQGRESKISSSQYTQAGTAIAAGGVQAFQGYNDPYANDLQKTRSIQAGVDTAKVGVATAINPLLGAGVGAVTKIGSGVQDNVDRTDANGNIINKNDSKIGEIAGGFLSPSNSLIGIYSDPNATTGQKVAGALTGGLSDMFTNRHKKQVESNAKANLNQNQFAFGGTNMQPNAEIESEENVVAPNGGFLQANGPTHEKGGVPVTLPGNSMIFSDRLKLGKKTFAELNKVNNTNKEDKVLESNKYGTTSKRTAELMKFAKNKNSEELFNAQEALKQSKVEAYAKRMGMSMDNQKFPMGGVKLPMYPDGGPVDSLGVKVDVAPVNYKFDRAVGNKQVYVDPGFIRQAPGSNSKADPDNWNKFLISQLQSGVSPDELSGKGYGTKEGLNPLMKYYKPKYAYLEPFDKKENSNNVQNPYDQRIDRKEVSQNMSTDVNYMDYPDANAGYSKATRVAFDRNSGREIDPSKSYDPKGNYKPFFNLETGRDLYKNTIKSSIPGTNPTNLNLNNQGDLRKEATQSTSFKYGGMKLPKFLEGGVSDDLTPEQQYLKTKFMGAEQNQRNLAFNQMTGNTNPGFSTYNSDYQNALQQARNEVANSAKKSQQSQEEELQLANDVINKQHGWNHNNPSTKPKSKIQNERNFDWKGLGSNVAMGLANNAGNIYNLSRYNKPEVEKYDRMKATLLDPSAAMRDATEQTRRAEYNVRGASGGNAGTYLSNRVGLNAQNIMTKDRIQKEYQNANAGIANSVGQYNNELSRQEVIANAMNRARTRSGKGEAIGSMGSNIANQMMDNKKGNMDQETLQLMMKYYNDPQFKKYLEESGFNKKKTGK